MEPEGFWWKAVSCGLPAGEIFLMGYCLYRMVKPFMGKSISEEGQYLLSGSMPSATDKKGGSREKGAVWVGTAYVLVMLGLYVMSMWRGVGRSGQIMGGLAVFFVMCLADRRNYRQKAFLVLTFFALHRFVGAMAEIVYDNLYYRIGNTDYITAHPNLSFALFAGMCGFYACFELLVMGIGIWLIIRTYQYRQEMSLKELVVLVTPSLMGLTGYWVIWYYRYFYIVENQSNSDIQDILSLLYYVVAMIVIVAVIALYQSIKAVQEEKLQNDLLAVQMEEIRRHLEQAENLYQDIRSLRHDMTNHIVTLERLYAVNRTEEAKAYSLQLKAALSRTAGEIRSGNPVTDVILLGIKTEAEKKKIDFQADFHYPAGSRMNAFDISVILNNALQNALDNAPDHEAENMAENALENALRNDAEKRSVKSENPYIWVRSYRRNNAYMIEIRNSFTGRLQWDAERGLPVSSKGNREGCGQAHGYGLANIRRVARKYSGDMAIDVRDGEFCVSIMLMLE
ncbi:MAG TPA: hypothetical protein DCZ91_25680 [Lachnospiraceae bacterium]|nr:hypothetical protein [Lachnospiraceae bacterium]